VKRKLAILLVLLVVASSSLAVLSYDLWKPATKEVASPTIVPSPTPTVPRPSPTTTPTEQPANKTPTELRVFAAGGLMHVVEKHQESFERENNVKVISNFASSDTLYQQIYSGFPCDAYMSADSKWTKKLKTDGLLDNDQYWNFTTNPLIVILPTDNPENITTLLDLVRPNTKIALGTWRIPVGTYTNMTLTEIQKTWGNRSDPRYKGPQWEHYRDKIISNVVSYEPMVTTVTTKVLLGVVDAGIVFVSEAKFVGPRLQYIEIPSSVNTIGTLGIAVIKNIANRDLATKYVGFWLSEEGQKLLADYGFGATP
jgi:molybdate transport system substrate-binding protein